MKNSPGIWLIALGMIGSFPDRSLGENWPSFRGEGASGLSEIEGPLTWDLETNESLLWKSPIPGLGLSSPVIQDGRVYLTTAVAEAGDAELKVGLYGNIASADDDGVHSYRVLCLDAGTGEILWNREVNNTKPAIQRHTKASHANCTVATDGNHVVAFFGSEGLYCLDPDGNLIWEKTFGTLDSGYFMVPSAQWGFASSPVVHEGRIILQCDVQEGSFVAAFDITNGEEVWKTTREEVPTWSTPCLIEHDGKTQVILNGFKHIGGYDFDTGREIWKLEGGGDIPVPTPIYRNGLILITNAHGAMAPIYAIRPHATGKLTAGSTDDSTSDSIVWWHRRGGNYMQTPIVVGKHAFFCSDMGVMSCYDTETGRQLFRERLRKGNTGFGFTASPVSDGSKIYYCTEDGQVIITKATSTFEILAQNAIEEKCMATPALVGGVLYLRTENHLMAIGNNES